MDNTLIYIDAYANTLHRKSILQSLIAEIRAAFPDNKLLLHSKCEVEKEMQASCDYTLITDQGFKIGKIPEHLKIDSKTDYWHFNTSLFIMDREVSSGISDHAGNIFNSHVIASKFAEMLGFSRILRFEYDVSSNSLDMQRLKSIVSEDTSDFSAFDLDISDYPQQFFYAPHISHFKSEIFSSEKVLENEEAYWKKAVSIDYIGKWAEMFTLKMAEHNAQSITNWGNKSEMMPYTKFDVAAVATRNDGFTFPYLCINGREKDGKFYLAWTAERYPMYVKTSLKVDSSVIFEEETELQVGHWKLKDFVIDENATYSLCTVIVNRETNALTQNEYTFTKDEIAETKSVLRFIN